MPTTKSENIIIASLNYLTISGIGLFMIDEFTFDEVLQSWEIGQLIGGN